MAWLRHPCVSEDTTSGYNIKSPNSGLRHRCLFLTLEKSKQDSPILGKWEWGEGSVPGAIMFSLRGFSRSPSLDVSIQPANQSKGMERWQTYFWCHSPELLPEVLHIQPVGICHLASLQQRWNVVPSWACSSWQFYKNKHVLWSIKCLFHRLFS